MLGSGERGPAERVGAEDDLVVLEVGGLEPDLDAVRERQHRDAERVDLPARHHGAAGGRLLEELAPRRAVFPWRDRDLRHRRQHAAHFRLRGHGHALLLGGDGQDDAAVLVDVAQGDVADFVEGDGGQELPHQRQLDVDPGAGLAGEEVGHVLPGVRAALALVPLLPGALVLGEQLAARAVQLGGREAVAAHALRFREQGAQAGRDAAVGDDGAQHLRVRIAADRAARGRRAQEGRVPAARHLGQTRVHHGVEQRLDQAAPVITDPALRKLGMLEDDGDAGHAGLGIGGDADQRLGVAGDVVDGTRGTGRGRRDFAQLVLDPALGLDRIHVTDHRHRHAVRPIPFARERAQPGGVRALDDVGIADGQALGVTRAVHEDGELQALQARVRALAQAPFLQHDPALLVDLVLAQRPAAREVGEDGETLLHEAAAVAGHLEDVHRLVEAGVRIGVRAEARADGLQEPDELAGGEVLAAVEGHVLEEVGEAALVLLLEDGAGIDGQPQRHPVLGPRVAADVVGHPVRQPAATDGGVEGERVLQPVGRRGGRGAGAGPRTGRRRVVRKDGRSDGQRGHKEESCSHTSNLSQGGHSRTIPMGIRGPP